MRKFFFVSSLWKLHSYKCFVFYICCSNSLWNDLLYFEMPSCKTLILSFRPFFTGQGSTNEIDRQSVTVSRQVPKPRIYIQACTCRIFRPSNLILSTVVLKISSFILIFWIDCQMFVHHTVSVVEHLITA